MLSYYISQLRSILYVAPVMLLAIIVHECAHGWVSDKLGDPTPRMSGRLTLNPLKHLDPMGTLCLLVFHMGWANPVPINPYYYKDRKKGLILVSLAGPIANMLLACISILLEGLLLLYAPNTVFFQTLAVLFWYSAVLNVGLGVFNLIPIPPLDGSKILFALLPDRIYYTILRYEKYVMGVVILLVLVGVFDKPLSFLMVHVLQGFCTLTGMPLGGLLLFQDASAILNLF